MKKQNKKEYVKSLEDTALVELYEATIKHKHYCPFNCTCFLNFELKFDGEYDDSTIYQEIMNRMFKGDITLREEEL